MKKRILIALALCMALGTACGKKEVEEEKTLRSVEVTTVGKGDIASEFSYTGKAAPAKEVSVVPTVPGKVLSFNYDVGDKVGQGAVLFTDTFPTARRSRYPFRLVLTMARASVSVIKASQEQTAAQEEIFL